MTDLMQAIAADLEATVSEHVEETQSAVRRNILAAFRDYLPYRHEGAVRAEVDALMAVASPHIASVVRAKCVRKLAGGLAELLRE